MSVWRCVVSGGADVPCVYTYVSVFVSVGMNCYFWALSLLLDILGVLYMSVCSSVPSFPSPLPPSPSVR